jgi:SAM-dependent methyltransferase
MRSGEVVPRQAVAVGPRFAARADVLTSLGLQVSEHPLGTHVAADPSGLTEIPGVWVAGNVTDPTAQVIGAAAAGSRAAAAINADLVQEEVQQAVAVRRARHGHLGGDHRADSGVSPQFDQEFWDELYRSRGQRWSGEPNPHLVSETADITPGTALDVGSGEGADAIWLAQRGWQVTAVDLSTIALDRGATRAAAQGTDVASRIDWLHEDLTSWLPAEASYDLATAQYLHLPTAPREAIFRRLAASVAPGGTLLIVGHHPSDLQTTIPRPPMPQMFFTASDVAAALDPDQWEILVSAARVRHATDPEGRTVPIHDAVLRARRRP